MLEKIKDKILAGEKYGKKFKLKINEIATVNMPAMINNANEWIDKTN